MKKFIYMTVAALVMLTTLSCEKEKLSPKDNPSSVEKVDMEFNAETVGAEKTTVKDGVVAIWSENDVIKVFTDKDTQGSQCAITKGAGTQIATFSGQCAKEGPWTAVCPADKATGFNNGTVTLTMPENQTYTLNTFASGTLPCVAFSDNANFVFPHSFGVLKLSLIMRTDKIEEIKSITITDKSGAKLNGTFTVNPSVSPVATKSGADGTSSITLDCSGSTVLVSRMEPKYFWFVVPEGAFANGLDVTITSSKDIEFKFSTTQANTITAGKIKVMPIRGIEFILPEIGRGTATAIINGVETPVNWIQLWEGGPKFAEYNMSGEFKWGSNKSLDPYCSMQRFDIQGSEFDPVTQTWGDNWQLPTKADFEALRDNCNLEFYRYWSSPDDKPYCIFRGKGAYADNSIKLPGWNDYIEGEICAYWSSTANENQNVAYSMRINYTYQANVYISDIDRSYYYYYRPIIKEPYEYQGEATTKDGKNVKWLQMWENGPKWAVQNVGAESVYESGGTYGWGGHTNGNKEDVCDVLSNIKYNPNYDTARYLWGDNWQMPSDDDFSALINNCDYHWDNSFNQTGVQGMVITGRGKFWKNRLFIPLGDNNMDIWSSVRYGTDPYNYPVFRVGSPGYAAYCTVVNDAYRYNKACILVRAILHE